MHNNTPIMAKMNDISDTINRISSRYQQMQKYEAYKDKLEMSTLITFAEWTVSPNAHSVHHLMDRLHIILLGNEDRSTNATSTNLLQQLTTAYEVIQSNFYVIYFSYRSNLRGDLNWKTIRFSVFGEVCQVESLTKLFYLIIL